MKITTPEIWWHAKEAIYSVDIQPKQENQPLRVATAGIDSNVRIWELKPEIKTGVSFLSNLTRHEKAVNVVRFSKSGQILASGGDDGTIVLWKLSDKTDAPNIFDDDSEIGKNVETWNAYKVLRGHLEDINDLNWSSEENFMISGSIDQTVILWDVVKGTKMSILSEAKHFIQGVAWDPLGLYAASLSGDRSLRIYNIQTKRVIHNVCKMVYPEPEEVGEDVLIDGEDTPTVKSQRIFHDESVVRRRLDFTCDGSLLIVPSGCLTKKQGDQVEQINTAYVFTRGCLSKPAAVLPGFKQPVTVVRCCPTKFQLRENGNGNTDSSVKLPYRYVFAVSSSDTLLLYDTQNLEPFAFIGNIHYAAITDITWSSDSRNLVVSSRDGFCTIVKFEENELGIEYSENISSQEEQNNEVLCNGIESTKLSNDCKPNKITNNEDKVTEKVEVEKPAMRKGQGSKGIGLITGQICLTAEKSTARLSVDNGCTANRELDAENGNDKMDTDDVAKDCNAKVDSVSSSNLSQETKPPGLRGTLSDSPRTKTPRRVALTTVASPKTDSTSDKVTPSKLFTRKAANHLSPAFGTPKTSSINTTTEHSSTEKKKTPRRIKLLSVKD